MNNNLKNTWIEIEGQLTLFPESKLRELLLQKSRRMVNRFRWMVGIGITTCAGVLIFLAIASYSLLNDTMYLINNGLLAILLMVALIYNIRLLHDLSLVIGESSNVYDLLKEKEGKIEQAMQQKKQLFLLPVFSFLLLLSIHVYYSGGSFTGAFQNEENMWGLAFGFLSGLLVAIYFERKINRHQQNDLKALRRYMQELETLD